MARLPKFFEEFRTAYPAVAKSYEDLGAACRSAGPLDDREADLVKLALSIGAGTQGAAHSHARRALASGATEAQLEQVALLAITTLGFARAMAGLAWIRDVTRPKS